MNRQTQTDKSGRNVVDSSGWLEYFADADNAQFFVPAIEDVKNLIVPSISLFEVFKHVLRHRSEKQAFECIECMMQGTIIDLNIEISLNAAKLGLQYKIPLQIVLFFQLVLRMKQLFGLKM